MARRVKIYRVLVGGNPRSRWAASEDVALKIAENILKDKSSRRPTQIVSIETSYGYDHSRLGGGIQVIDGSPSSIRQVDDLHISRNRIKRRMQRQKQSRNALEYERRRRERAEDQKDALKDTNRRLEEQRRPPRYSQLDRAAGDDRPSIGQAPPSQRALGIAGKLEAGASDEVTDQPAPAYRKARRNLEKKQRELRVNFRSGGAFFEVNFDGKYRYPAMAHFIEADRGGGLRLNSAAMFISGEAKREINMALSREAVRSVKGGPSILKGRGRYPYGLLRGRGPDGRPWEPLESSTLFFRYLKAGGAAAYGSKHHHARDRDPHARRPRMAAFVTPDGQFFDPETGHVRKIDAARGQGFKLRETSDHIFHGLEVLRVGEDMFEIGWAGYHKDTGEPVSQIALKQHRGFVTRWSFASDQGYTGGKTYTFNVPGRPFIGLQPEFFRNAEDIVVALIKWHMLGRRTKLGGQVVQNVRLGSR